jgi:hypothetical protein
MCSIRVIVQEGSEFCSLELRVDTWWIDRKEACQQDVLGIIQLIHDPISISDCELGELSMLYLDALNLNTT